MENMPDIVATAEKIVFAEHLRAIAEQDVAELAETRKAQRATPQARPKGYRYACRMGKIRPLHESKWLYACSSVPMDGLGVINRS